MPHSELHKKKLKKNITIGLMILLWCALIWMVTMIKIANAAEAVDTHVHHVKGFTYRGRNYSGLGIDRIEADVKAPMYNSRYKHRQHNDATTMGWYEKYQAESEQRQGELEQRETGRHNQLTKNVASHDGWDKGYRDGLDAQMQTEHVRDQGRMAHMEATIARQHGWAEDWSARQQQKAEREAAE